MRNVLKQEKRLYVLENLIPNAPTKDAKEEARNEHERHINNDEQAACVI
jgi:hypothetical protein